ncbi:MAG TPA: Crp/Fnr family transcriptional regulator [Nitrospiraceae bacterium]|nr:Crp/Fnr family transcriptional regulator [Nitrospiraceae bacterium]
MRGNALLTRLRTFGTLGEADEQLLADACRDVRGIAPKRHIIQEGDRPEQVHLIVDGWAARYKSVANGARQIVAFLLPGDFCDLHTAVLGHMDHSIVAITTCHVAFIPSAQMDELTSNHNGLTRALWWGTLVDEGVLRSWVVNVGRREAHERIAHLLCELYCRLELVDLVKSDSFDLPITQEELADATGLTSVHTNRTLQRLRREGLIKLENRRLYVPNVKALHKVAGFDPSYLHIRKRERADM